MDYKEAQKAVIDKFAEDGTPEVKLPSMIDFVVRTMDLGRFFEAVQRRQLRLSLHRVSATGPCQPAGWICDLSIVGYMDVAGRGIAKSANSACEKARRAFNNSLLAEERKRRKLRKACKAK